MASTRLRILTMSEKPRREERCATFKAGGLYSVVVERRAVTPSVARDLGGRGTRHVHGAPPAQVPRYARDDTPALRCPQFPGGGGAGVGGGAVSVGVTGNGGGSVDCVGTGVSEFGSTGRGWRPRVERRFAGAADEGARIGVGSTPTSVAGGAGVTIFFGSGCGEAAGGGADVPTAPAPAGG